MEDLVRPEIEDYAEQHSMGESAVCRELREETERTMELARMLVGPLEAAFLKMMVKLVRARRVLEIGMFTGYSALSMAEALPPDGEVITCEIDPEPIAMARRYFARSGQGSKITIQVGPALETLQDARGPFDLIFIDADKQNYINYYKRALELIAPTGVILIDNVLWSGRVTPEGAKHDTRPDETEAIKRHNELIYADPGFATFIHPVRDGLLFSLADLARRGGVQALGRQLFQSGTYPPHYQYFTRRSLAGLLDKLGLAPRASIDDLDFEPEQLGRRLASKGRVIQALAGVFGRSLGAVVQATGRADSRLVIAERAR